MTRVINHVRSLLVDLKPGGAAWPGEEHVPAEYAPRPLSAELKSVRRILFGEDPDRLMVNYRAAQLLACVHAGRLAPYAYASDPRVTYEPGGWAGLFEPANFAPVVIGPDRLYPPDGNPRATVSGTPQAPDASGKCRYRFLVFHTPENGKFVRSRHSPTFAEETHLDGPLIPLPGAGLTLRVPRAEGDDSWDVRVDLRPRRQPADLVAAAEKMGAGSWQALFGRAGEPFATFRNAWQDGRETPLRAAALALALAYATERERAARG